jgi:hypothetical protein
MTPAEINQVLRQMDHCRHLHLHAMSVADQDRLFLEWSAHLKRIRPFISSDLTVKSPR